MEDHLVLEKFKLEKNKSNYNLIYRNCVFVETNKN